MSGVGLGAGAWIGLNPLNSGQMVRGISALPSGVSTYSVTYPASVGTSNYVLLLTISNITDATPRHLAATITAKSATGFSFGTQQTTDTSNYRAEWLVIKL